MGMWDNVLLALQALKANKMRALLTMLGIIIGIGAVIAIFTVGDSLSGSINDVMSEMGASDITVTVTARNDDDEDTLLGLSSMMNSRSFTAENPTEDDLITDAMIDEYKKDLGSRTKYVLMNETIGSGMARTTVDGNSEDVTCIALGVSEDYFEAKDVNILYGRIPTREDGERRLILVSDYVANHFWGIGSDAVGKTINLNLQGNMVPFFICGIYEYEESEMETMIQSMAASMMSSSTKVTPVYTNMPVAKQLNHSTKGYKSITVVAAASENATEYLDVVQDYFQSFYTRNASFTAKCSNLESITDSVTDLLNKVKIAIAAIAAISLLVGGIGVMNIMLVSITERTREIGTRKALGAPNLAIRLQFITESVVICVIGGIIGTIFGIALAAFATNLLNYACRPSIGSILIATGFSMAIGIFFGYYPANKAAKLNPIDALRYE